METIGKPSRYLSLLVITSCVMYLGLQSWVPAISTGRSRWHVFLYESNIQGESENLADHWVCQNRKEASWIKKRSCPRVQNKVYSYFKMMLLQKIPVSWTRTTDLSQEFRIIQPLTHHTCSLSYTHTHTHTHTHTCMHACMHAHTIPELKPKPWNKENGIDKILKWSPMTFARVYFLPLECGQNLNIL